MRITNPLSLVPNNSRRPRSIKWCRQAAPRGRGKALPSPGRPALCRWAGWSQLRDFRLASEKKRAFPALSCADTAHTQAASSPSRDGNKQVPPSPKRRCAEGSAGGRGQVARAAGQPLNAPEALPHPTGFSFQISPCFDQS